MLVLKRAWSTMRQMQTACEQRVQTWCYAFLFRRYGKGQCDENTETRGHPLTASFASMLRPAKMSTIGSAAVTEGQPSPKRLAGGPDIAFAIKPSPSAQPPCTGMAHQVLQIHKACCVFKFVMAVKDEKTNPGGDPQQVMLLGDHEIDPGHHKTIQCKRINK